MPMASVGTAPSPRLVLCTPHRGVLPRPRCIRFTGPLAALGIFDGPSNAAETLSGIRDDEQVCVPRTATEFRTASGAHTAPRGWKGLGGSPCLACSRTVA